MLFCAGLYLSVLLHAAILIRMPMMRVSSLPAVKGVINFINVSLQEVEIKSRSNIASPKQELEKPEKKEVVKKDTIPLAKEEKKEEKQEEETKEKVFIPPPPSISKEAIVKLRESYEDKILKKIHAMKYYPLGAQRRGQEGVVGVAFTLSRNGMLHGAVDVIKPCRYTVLNDSAVKTIIASNPFPSFPKEIKTKQMVFALDIDFHMEIW